jgi:hypothetical protein
VSVVPPKRVKEAPWRRKVAEIMFALFLRKVQLVLKSSVFTVLDLDG